MGQHIHVQVIEVDPNPDTYDRVVWEGTNHSAKAAAKNVCRNLNELDRVYGVSFTVHEKSFG
jgi:hypothetical protein